MTDHKLLSTLDAIAQADLVRRKEVTQQELFEACLARIEKLNPLVRALVTIADDQPQTTAQGPFAGVPFVMKDASPWLGQRWSIGSRLFAKNIAPAHTPYSKRLAESGLICIGKSATSEFGLLGSTETLLEGVTHNPWDLSFSAAGSSGGSAAAVAAGIVPIAHANDGGGSIRIPASVCGLFGFKPSRGRTVPASFVSSEFLEITSDHCISRSVRDSALFLDITEDKTVSTPVGFVRDPIAKKLKIAAYTRTAMGESPEPAVLRAFESTCSLLRDLGHEVQHIDGPPIDGKALGEAFYLVAGSAIAAVVKSIDTMRRVPVQENELEPFTWALVNGYEAKGPDSLVQAKNVFNSIATQYREATANFDVVLTPTLATTAWRIGHLSPILDRDELVLRTSRSVGYTPLQNIVGCPAMSVPLFFEKGNLPIGSHFAAAPGQDALLLALAYQLEQARPWAEQWAPYSIARLGLCLKF